MGEQYYLNIMLELEADASTTEMPKIVNESDNGGRTNALRRSKYPRSGTCYGIQLQLVKCGLEHTRSHPRNPACTHAHSCELA